jgi:hypothetical protein
MKISKGLICAALLLIAACNNSEESTSSSDPERLTIPGAGTDFGTKGVFDPSLTEDPESGRIYMSYSAVDPAPAYWGVINYHTVSTRMAYSDDNGESFTDSGSAINEALDVILGDGEEPWEDDAGTWHNEVSKLIYDPGAQSGEEWKLFWHHYLVHNQLGDPVDYRKFHHGWIAYKAASTPEGLESATEVKLFGAAGYDTVNDTEDNTVSRSPLGGAPEIMLDGTFHADLANCVVFSEPGAYADSTGLYLSLFCYEVTPAANNRLILLKANANSDLTDSGNWTYIGTLFQTSDAVSLGYERFSASDLFGSGGEQFLMVSPVSDSPYDGSYNGCLVYRFSDIGAGTLSGTPDLVKSVSGTAGSFNGACAYHESASYSGFLYSELVSGEEDPFRIFMSKSGL